MSEYIYRMLGMRREDMTDKEVMRLAFEALDSCVNGWSSIGEDECRSMHFDDDLVEEAKGVLSERLEQPERREWVGLTEEDWLALGCKTSEEIRVGLAIQAKLREKNGI